MKYTIFSLLFLAAITLIAGIRFIAHDVGAYHEIKGGLALLTSAVFFSGAAIVDAIGFLRDRMDR